MTDRVEIPLGEIPTGEMKRVEIAGEGVCVANLGGGKLCAVSDTCTHALASLSEGILEGDEVICPLHGAMFDLRDGKVTCGPATSDLRSYPVRVEGEMIIVDA